MTPEQAKHYIELGHIAHEGFKTAWMEFGPFGAQAMDRVTYERVTATGITQERALANLVAEAKKHPRLQGQHLYWRKHPVATATPEEWSATCRVLTTNRCDVNLDAQIEIAFGVDFAEEAA